MIPIALDTNVYDKIRLGDPAASAITASAERLCISAVVLGELLAGFEFGSRRDENRRLLRRFLDSPRVAVLPLSERTSDVYAQVFAHLRRKGKPIPGNDLWIAASALEHGLALYTYDRHFEAVAGLRCGQKPEDFLLSR